MTQRAVKIHDRGDALAAIENVDGTLSLVTQLALEGGTIVGDENPLPGIDFVHENIHEAISFAAGHLWLAVAAGSSVGLHIATGPNKELHWTAELSAGLISYVRPYEDTTFLDNGIQLTIFNLKRSSVNPSDAVVYRNPVVNALGTALPPTLIPGAERINQGAGSSVAGRQEWILKPSTEYFVEVENAGAQAAAFSMTGLWYELDP